MCIWNLLHRLQGKTADLSRNQLPKPDTPSSPELPWSPCIGTFSMAMLGYSIIPREAPCPPSDVLWKAAQLTWQKWATSSNLLCYIFLVTAQTTLFPGESGSGAWWDHPGCWLMGSWWHSWRPHRKMQTTWHLPRSERGLHKPWITLPKECSSLMYSVGENVISRENFIRGHHLWIVVEHLHCAVKQLENILALVYSHIQTNIFLWK